MPALSISNLEPDALTHLGHARTSTIRVLTHDIGKVSSPAGSKQRRHPKSSASNCASEERQDFHSQVIPDRIEVTVTVIAECGHAVVLIHGDWAASPVTEPHEIESKSRQKV